MPFPHASSISRESPNPTLWSIFFSINWNYMPWRGLEPAQGM